MQDNVTPKPYPKASAVQAIMNVESTLTERVAILACMTRIVDDMVEIANNPSDARIANGLSYLLQETSKALSTSIDTLELAVREVRA